MERDAIPDHELPPALRRPLQARLGPADPVWAVIPGDRDESLVATSWELLYVIGGRIAGSWWLADLDDIRPVGGASAILVRRRDGAGGAVAFRVGDDRPDAIQSITVLELLIARAAKAADAGAGRGAGARRDGAGRGLPGVRVAGGVGPTRCQVVPSPAQRPG
jgi:hypothetical protein